jgi:hypothetical protein
MTDLEEDEDENSMSIIAGDLFVYAGLTYVGDFVNDKRTARWEERYAQIKQALDDQATMDETSGATVVSPAYNYPDDEDCY